MNQQIRNLLVIQLLTTSFHKTRSIQVFSSQKQQSILVLDVLVFQVQLCYRSIDVFLQQQLNWKEETLKNDFQFSKLYSIHLNLVTQDACSNPMLLNLTQCLIVISQNFLSTGFLDSTQILSHVEVSLTGMISMRMKLLLNMLINQGSVQHVTRSNMDAQLVWLRSLCQIKKSVGHVRFRMEDIRTIIIPQLGTVLNIVSLMIGTTITKLITISQYLIMN